MTKSENKTLSSEIFFYNYVYQVTYNIIFYNKVTVVKEYSVYKNLKSN